MSQTYYEVFCGRIVPVEVNKVTPKTVTLANGQRRSRAGWSSFYPSWDDARLGMIKLALEEVRDARDRLVIAKGKLGNAKGMKRPDALADCFKVQS